MRVLVLAGAGALALTMPITVGIVIVLAIVVTSYRQTIAAYPNGGGSYIVASDNLGHAAGADRRRRAADRLRADRGGLGRRRRRGADLDRAGAVRVSRRASASRSSSLIAMINLRGIRESGLVFSIPTYVYLVAIFGAARARLLPLRDRHDADYHAPPRG